MSNTMYYFDTSSYAWMETLDLDMHEKYTESETADMLRELADYIDNNDWAFEDDSKPTGFPLSKIDLFHLASEIHHLSITINEFVKGTLDMEEDYFAFAEEEK